MSAAATPATAAEASHTYRNSIPSDGEHDAGAVDFTCGRAPPSRACRREGSRSFRLLGAVGGGRWDTTGRRKVRSLNYPGR